MDDALRSTRRPVPLRRCHRASGDGGAVLVEAALVLPLLFALVFGMIDFGVTLSDQIAVRDGVREGVRQAVVPASGVDTDDDVVRVTKQRIGVSESVSRVRVVVDGTTAGSEVTVCAYVPMRSLSGLYSQLLDGRYMWSKVTMRLEADKSTLGTGGDDPPDDHDWSRCNGS